MAKAKTDPQAALNEARAALNAARDRAVEAFERADEARLELGRAQAAATRDGLPQDLKAHAQQSRLERVQRAEQALRAAEQEALAAAEGVRDAEAAVERARLEVARPEIEAGQARIRAAISRYVDALLGAVEAGGEARRAYDQLTRAGLPAPASGHVAPPDDRALADALEAAIRVGAPVRGKVVPREAADHVGNMVAWIGREGVDQDFAKLGERALQAEADRQRQQDAENARVEALRREQTTYWSPVDALGRPAGGKGKDDDGKGLVIG